MLKQGVAGAEYITPLVFMIVLGTVLLNATTARMFAKIIGVFLKKSNGILFVGASDPARLIASFLRDKGKRVVLIDSNKDFIEQAEKEDLEAINADVYDDSLTDNIELNDIGYSIAMTGSDTVNQHTIKTFSKNLGEHGYFKLASSLEIANASEEQKEHFFTPNDDYINLSEAYRENPEIIEVKIKNETEYNNILNLLSFEEKSIPLFIETSKNIYLVAEFEKLQDPKENITFSYLGKKLEQDYRSSSKD